MSKRQLLVMKISSKWRNFRFSVLGCIAYWYSNDMKLAASHIYRPTLQVTFSDDNWERNFFRSVLLSFWLELESNLSLKQIFLTLRYICFKATNFVISLFELWKRHWHVDINHWCDFSKCYGTCLSFPLLTVRYRPCPIIYLTMYVCQCSVSDFTVSEITYTALTYIVSQNHCGP